MESEQRRTALIVGGIVAVIFLCCSGLGMMAFAVFSRSDAFKQTPVAPIAWSAPDAGDEDQDEGEEPTRDDSAARDAFATALLGEVNDAGTGLYSYDPDGYALHTDGGSLELGDLFAEWQRVPQTERPEYLRHVVRSMHPPPLPATWAEAQKDVRLSVRTALDLPSSGHALASRDVAPGVVAAIVYDHEDGMQFLREAQLTTWGVSVDQAYATGLQNLEAASARRFEAPSEGVYRSPWHDNYDASRLLLTATLQRLRVKGKPVAFIPNRDTLIVTGSADDEGLAAAARLVDEALDEPRPMTGRAWVLDGSWKPFLPPAISKAFVPMRGLVKRAEVREATAQQEALEARLEESEPDLAVGSLLLGEETETGDAMTYCVWLKGTESLLPRADYVVFIDPELPEDRQLVAASTWEKAQQVMARALVPEPRLSPPRFRVKTFPSARALKTLGIHPNFSPEEEQ